MRQIEMRVEFSIAQNACLLYMVDRMQGQYMTLDGWQKLEPGLAYPPVLTLSPSDAQVLADDLWKAGVRPTEAAGTAGSLSATQSHLNDIRGILQLVLPVAIRKD